MLTAKIVYSNLIKDGAEAKNAKAFIDYHFRRPHLWAAFENAAMHAINQGATRLSSKAIGEDLRRDPYLGGESYTDWKVCNTWLNYYGRLFAMKYPIYAHLFEFKTFAHKEAA